jgi:tetratricopeptide (TPR) repeat protein
MRTKERHHLKENELALALGRANEFAARHQRTITVALVAIVVVGVAVAGFYFWRSRVESTAVEALAQAMVVHESRVVAPPTAPPDSATPPAQAPGTFATEKAKLEAALPKFLAAADAYPQTEAGKTARYHAAATLVALGRFDEAIQQYDRLRDAGGLIGPSARLGKAEAQLRARQYDAAIAAFKEISDRPDGNLPKEAVLLELARAYRVAGKPEDARKTLNQIVEQHADSPSATTAKQELEKIPG